MKISFMWKLKIFILASLFINGCIAESVNQPNLEKLKEYVFELDGIKYAISVPKGGTEGNYSVTSLDSTQETERDIALLTIGFDHVQSPTHLYDLTHFVFWLTKNGCCDLERASDFQRESGKHSEIREIAGTRVLYVESVDGVGNIVSKYIIPYSDNYNMVFMLSLDEKLLGESAAVAVRKKMLRDIVSTFRKKN